MPCASPPIWLSASTLRIVATSTSASMTPVSRPLAAEDADAAEQRDGDDVELDAERVVGAGIGEACRKTMPAMRADDARDDEQIRSACGACSTPE